MGRIAKGLECAWPDIESSVKEDITLMESRPYIFVTNGGGKSEEERCIQLSRQLEIEVSPGQFICGHTPMKEMADNFDTVLVVGGEGEKCREVAEAYGFKDGKLSPRSYPRATL